MRLNHKTTCSLSSAPALATKKNRNAAAATMLSSPITLKLYPSALKPRRLELTARGKYVAGMTVATPEYKEKMEILK